MARKEVYSRIKPEIHQRLDEMMRFWKVTSVSALIEKILEESITWMDSQKPVEITIKEKFAKWKEENEAKSKV